MLCVGGEMLKKSPNIRCVIMAHLIFPVVYP